LSRSLEKRDGVIDAGFADSCTTDDGVADKKGKAMKKLLQVIIPAMLLLCFFTLNTAMAENSLIQQYREAQKLETEGMCEEAIFAYQDILLENRFYIDARIGLARCYYATGKLRLARDTIIQALEQEEKNVEAWILLGRINT